MYDIWLKKIVSLGHNYVYCTQNKIDSKFNWIPLKNWDNSRPENPNRLFWANRDRENKRITMANFFLKQTNADFFINPTDDVFVDASRINNLADILGRLYNTEKDSVLLGDCINGSLIQGGSGYIMSREMARKFVKYSSKWLKESNGPDDVEIIRFLHYINQSSFNASSPFLCGRSFIGMQSIHFNPDSLPLCPNNFYDIECRQGVKKIEDIYLLHPTFYDINKDLIVWNNLMKIFNDSTHKYGWHSIKPSSPYHAICRFDSFK